MARRSRPPSTSPVGGVCPAPGGPGASLLDREVGFLKGVGPGRAALLSKLMIHTIGDLLLHLPRAYLDRRRVVGIDGLAPEMAATVAGEVIGARVRRVRGGRQDLLATVEDGTGRLSVVWFGQPYLSRIVRPGARLLLSGRVRLFQGLCLVNPDFDLAESGQEPVSGRAGILPVYPTTQGLSQRFLRGLAETALRLAGDPGEDPIPRHILDRLDLPPRDRALRAVHFPSTLEEAERSRRRLSFEELLVLQLLLKRAREERSTAASARPLRGDPDRLRAVRDRLPYRLTDEQEDAISAILADLQGERPAMRLLQGEVGSGKTVVAALACAWAASAESQSCVMAPTEVLAIQLAGALRAILDPVGMRVALLLGSTPGRERREILGRLAEGQVDTLVGTHAIIEEGVGFRDLGLVIVDEQHRFGVAQRVKLLEKGRAPHTVVMSATPIPRTLALAFYGDLDITTIRRPPPGRTAVRTRVLDRSRWDDLLGFIAQRLRQGEQAFFVYPVIEGTGARNLLDATRMFDVIRAHPALRGLSVALLHGRTDISERRRILEGLREGRISAVVATTIVEVGIDLPRATVMVVEHPERFGLAQLHQLRGRIGRAPGQTPHFFLIRPEGLLDEPERLAVLVRESDGFRIAEEDLRLRGPGEMLGTRQTGMPRLRVADLFRDRDLLERARAEAEDLSRADPNLHEARHRALRAEIDRHARERTRLLGVA